jgi:phospholipid/cholesterol/gamma-HCH transport system permease protein
MESVQDEKRRKKYSIESLAGTSPRQIRLRISGRVSLDSLKELAGELRTHLSPELQRLEIDLSKVSYLDTSGALALLRFRHEAERRAIGFQFVEMNPAVRRLMDHVMREGFSPPAGRTEKARLPAASALDDMGAAALRTLRNLSVFMSFTGEVFLASLHCLRHPLTIRWEDLLFSIKRVGVDGLPIVGMISFLLGLIMAFMSSLQLRQFGADVYVASLVAIAMVRELGPVMTAILVAGRSGSAFAAEIGTMKVNEEIGALVTMGFDTTRFLVIPKFFAVLIVLPVLTLYADLFAIIGGALVGVLGLNLTLGTYMQQTQISIANFDVVSSLIKSLFFAAAIGIVGCGRGFQAGGGAQSVGALTTSAVVTAISLIIVIDSIFAVVLQYIGPAAIQRLG